MTTIEKIYGKSEWFINMNLPNDKKIVEHNILDYDANNYISAPTRRQNVFNAPVNVLAEYVEKVKLQQKNFNYYIPEERKIYNPTEELQQEKSVLERVDDEFLNNEYIHNLF